MASDDVTTEMRFDYVVVGAGTAGSLLAARLAEDGTARVALIESGGHDRSLMTRIPLGFGKIVHDPALTWPLLSEPVPGLNGRRCRATAGKLVGGTSAINGLLQTRGHPSDYDDWAASGCNGWSHAEVLPFFERAEDALGLGQTIENLAPSPLAGDFLEACNAAGFSVPDHEDRSGQGAVLPRTAIVKGRRVSSGARLRRGSGTPSLFVNHSAERVEISDGRARGVLTRVAEKQVRFAATREVVICAGALRSPMLLFLSGIGEGEVLRKAGISVYHDLPGVGQNLQDHFGVHIAWTSQHTRTLNEILASPPRLAMSALAWLVAQRGALARPLAEGLLFAALGTSGRPDVEVILRAMDGSEEDGMTATPAISMTTYPLRPESRGRVRPASSDPKADPIFEPGYLSAQMDMDKTIAAIRLARRLAETAPLNRRLVFETRPGSAIEDETALADYIRANGKSASHYAGTCRMGRGRDAVVDPHLKVHGISGLRVADASVMPRLISGHTNAPTQMIAEKCAALMRASAV